MSIPRSKLSHHEEELWLRLRGDRTILTPIREYRFHPTRKWRFDFAWPDYKVAVEVEGVLWQGGGGRHQRVQGFLRDAEKYEAATLLGWTVYRVPGPWIDDRPDKVLTVIRQLLNQAHR